jgi:hypothetical protein
MWATTSKAALVFGCLIIGEAVRKQPKSKFASLSPGQSSDAVAVIASGNFKGAKVKDLDWAGCGKPSGFYARNCKSTEGCGIEKVYLDTPRQKCRFTNEYKLKPDYILKFFPVELARLGIKSATLAEKGCIFGGRWGKCYRRMRQIMRLLQYFRRAVDVVKKAGQDHPAYTYVTSPEVEKALKIIAGNIATGFKTHDNGGVEQALQDLGNLQDTIKSFEDEAESENQTMSEEEKETLKDCLTAEAMLKLMGTDLTEEQRKALCATVEANKGVNGDTVDETLIEQEEAGLDNVFDAAGEEDMKNLEQQEEAYNSDDDDDEEDAIIKEEEREEAVLEPDTTTIITTTTTSDMRVRRTDSFGEPLEYDSEDEDNSALIETSSGKQALTTRGGVPDKKKGTGPLKWLFKHGLGWIVTRVAWLVTFLLGSILGLVRAALFPVLFIGCTLVKFLSLVIWDIPVTLGWDGNTALFSERFFNIGRCGPAMWDLVGFDPTAENVVGQIVIQPAQFASKVTGVHHLYKSKKDLCDGVQCGDLATCHAGSCLCNIGYYPIPNTANCGLHSTKAGCVCKPSWVSGTFVTNKHFGCPPSKAKCEVDTSHPSFATCKGNLAGSKGWQQWGNLTDVANGLARQAEQFVVGKKATKDSCQPMRFRATVPALTSPAAKS